MSKAPWEFSPPASELKNPVPNLPTQIGAELGAELARLTEPELAKLREEFPDVPAPCVECAFVKGTVPNQCGSTLMDALKCVVEDEPFHCHKGMDDAGEPKRLCTGWLAASGIRKKLTAIMAVASDPKLVERFEKLSREIEKHDAGCGPRPPRKPPT